LPLHWEECVEREMNTFITDLLRIYFVLHEESQIEPCEEECRQESQILFDFKDKIDEVKQSNVDLRNDLKIVKLHLKVLYLEFSEFL
jgi:hypothetical protein